MGVRSGGSDLAADDTIYKAVPVTLQEDALYASARCSQHIELISCYYVFQFVHALVCLVISTCLLLLINHRILS